MQVRAKFVCNGVQKHESTVPGEGQEQVSMIPVSTGSEENKSFAKWTPAGGLSLCINEGTQAYGFFEPGKEYYVTLEAATTAPVVSENEG